MTSMKSETRRDFFRLAGAGVTGAALAGSARTSPALAGPAGAETPRPIGREDPRRDSVFSVRDFGASGDGKAIDTPAVNKAIDAAVAAGGGTVLFPAGTYACFSIHLQSQIELHLQRGATIVAAEGARYDAAEPKTAWDAYQDYGHNHWHNSLMWGEDLHDVSITGSGLIYGKGLSKGDGPGPKAEDPGVGNKSIALKNCRNVRVSNCTVNSPWDDGICLKSSYGLGYARATENVTITNCYVSGCWVLGSVLDGTWKQRGPGDHAYGTGRIKFGTESNGGFINIAISNCVFEGCQGLALETVDGAQLEDVSITNITMRNLVSAPLFLRLGARLRGPKESTKVGTLRRVNIGNIVCWNAPAKSCSILSGIPDGSIEDVSIHDVLIVSQGGGSAEQAAIQLPENEAKYPEPSMFGATPAYGFYVRHMKGLSMSNIRLKTENADARPAFYLEDVGGADFFRIQAQRSGGAAEFVLRNVEDFSVRYSEPVPDTRLPRAENVTLPANQMA